MRGLEYCLRGEQRATGWQVEGQIEMRSILSDGSPKRLGYCGRQREGLGQESVKKRRDIAGDRDVGARARFYTLIRRGWNGAGLDGLARQMLKRMRGSVWVEVLEDM